MRSSLRRITYSALLAILLFGIGSPTAQAQLGVSAGLNFDSAGDIETTANTSENETLDNATGYHIGVVYDLGLGPVNLRPGLLYRNVGSYDFTGVPEIDPDEANVTAFEVPVDVRVTVLPFPLVSPYILGGPKAFFPRSDYDEFDDELEDISFTFNVGVGAGISVPGVGLTLQPEFLYEFGASDYVDDFEVGDTDFEPTERKLDAFALRLNVLF